jgi:transposase
MLYRLTKRPFRPQEPVGGLAPAAQRLSSLSDGLRLLPKLAVVGDLGTGTRQTARGCAGSPWSQSGAERRNHRQSDGEDYRKGGIRGYDGGKRTMGRKRHIVVDVLGLLLVVMVHSAGIQDRNGAKQVLTRLISYFPGLKLVWADGAYAGKLVEWVASVLQRTLSIVKRPRKSQGFRVLQWRWIVERTFGWLNRSRRLSKDFEALPATTEAWIRIAMIQSMLRRLAAKI